GTRMKDSSPAAFVFSPASAAQATTLSLRLIRTAISSGQLISYRVGRRRLIFAEDLAAWVRAGGTTGPPSSTADTDRAQLAGPHEPSGLGLASAPASSGEPQSPKEGVSRCGSLICGR